MRKALASLAKDMLAAGLLDDEELDRIARGVEENIARAPWYFRIPFIAFFWVCGALRLRADRIFAACLAVHKPVIVRRMLGWAVLGFRFPIQVEVFSHPKVLSSRGIAEGAPLRPAPEAATPAKRNISREPTLILPPPPPTTSSLERVDDTVLDADFVIVGSGPGGAMAACALANRGFSVIVCEHGGVPRAATTSSVAAAARHHYAYGGNLAAIGRGPCFVPLLMGTGLGGSATFNAGSCPVPTAERWRSWGFDPDEMAIFADVAGQLYRVSDADSNLMGRQNAVMHAGCAKLGIRTAALARNAVNRDDIAAVSLIGGERAFKFPPQASLLQSACRDKAVVLTRCSVRRVAIRGGRAEGVLAHDGKRTRFIRSRAGVIVSGGALQTPMLLRRSGLRHPGIGRASFFQLNTNVLGLMREPVRGWLGIEQGMISRDFERDGIVLEAVYTPFSLTVPYYPGTGTAQYDALSDLAYVSQQGVIVDADCTPLRVRSVLGAPLVTFRLHRDDSRRIRNGLALCVRILDAEGSRGFLVPGAERWFATAEEALSFIETTPDGDLHLASVHLIGTCPMGESENMPIDMRCRTRGAAGLWVMDGSVIPGSTGVNPQMTILTIALRAAKAIAQELGK